MVIVGSEFLRCLDVKVMLKKIYVMCDEFGVVNGDWNGFNVFYDVGGIVGVFDIGFVLGMFVLDVVLV